MTRIHPYKLYRIGNFIQLIAVSSLLLVVLFGKPTLFNVVPLIVLSVGMIGVVNPNAQAIYISYFSELSGSASAFNATVFFSLGALLGVFTGIFYDGTLLPMAAVMVFASLSSNIVSRFIPKPLGRFRPS